jgi:hypothetical protein
LSVAGSKSELILAVKVTVSVLLVPKVELSSTVSVVNLPVLGVVLPMVGGLDRSNVPPNVIVPEPVIGPPVRVKPLTVPAVPTEVTVPVVGVAHEGTPDARVKT